MSDKIKEQVEKERYRRKCIVDIMKDQGFYSVKNLSEILVKEYDIVVKEK